MSVQIGNDAESGNSVTIADKERRQGLYLLGKTGMGKTNLLATIIKQDINNGHGVFFLDPHGDAINNLVPQISRTPLVIDPEDEFYSFGINPLFCVDVDSERERL